MSLVGSLVTMAAIDELWKAMGGTIRFVQSRFGVILPEVVPLLLIASLTIYLDEQALVISPW